MNILWLVNISFPEVDRLLTGIDSKFSVSGGWILGAAEALVFKDNFKLYVVSVDKRVKKLTRLKGEKITYYLIPQGKGFNKVNNEYDRYCIQIRNEVLPDIIHIYGTEFTHGHSYLKACGNENVILSIQGILAAIAEYYNAGISWWDIYRNITLFDVIRGSMTARKRKFQKRAQYEQETIMMTKYIIGRTEFDYARVKSINPEVLYYKCNETLRAEFYTDEKWEYNNCIKHSIFLSQSSYPLKGLQQVLKAMPFILHYYPDTQIRIAGKNIIKNDTLKDLLYRTSYGKYIHRLIKKLSLEEFVTFTGRLDAEQMKQEYLNCNVFICPSSVENSPNSIGEAQILGTPCIASYTGGIPSIMKGDEDNLYRYEEIPILAEKICRVFSAKNEQSDMRSIALERHDIKKNSERLLEIYNCIIRSK